MSTLTNSRPSSEMPKNYFGLIKFALKVGAVNIDGNDSTAYRIYSIFILVFITILYPIFDFLQIFKIDFTTFSEEVLMYIFAYFMTIFKTLTILINREKFRNLFNKLEQAPFTANPSRGGDQEEKILKECIWITTLQTRTYYSMAIICTFILNINTLVSRLIKKDFSTLPYGPFDILNTTYSPNYEVSWIYECISGSYFGIQFLSVDLIGACTLAHISYQFKMLQNNIRRLVFISYENMSKDSESVNVVTERISAGEIDGSLVPWNYLKNSLKDAVNYNLAIINLAQEMESLFSTLLLTVFLTTIVLICFVVYNTSMLSPGDPKLASSIVQVLIVCLQIALVCYWGEQVVFQSQEVGRATFESNFVGTDLRFQKALALIIRRSQIPSKLTAGKFAVVSLPTFAWVLRTSYSAFMVLKSKDVKV